MLLRRSSIPILKSLLPHAKEPSPEREMIHPITRTRSLTLSSSFPSPIHAPVADDSMRKIARVLSENDLREVRKPVKRIVSGLAVEEEKVESGFRSWESAAALEEDGCGVGGSGGKVCAGGGGGSESWDANHGNNGTDIYFQRMIEANPGNALLLGNYARFLKEVRNDFARAKEYCGRAILENPNDGNILSMYADLIWEGDKNAHGAESYFNQAIKAAPDDCYVLASYAQFLWDAGEEEEEEEEEEEKEGEEVKDTMTKTSASGFLNGNPTPTPISAAS